MKTKFSWLWGLFLMLSSVILAYGPVTEAMAAEKQRELIEHEIPVFTDNSGPFADVGRAVNCGVKTVFSWWNAEKAKSVGIKLRPKMYDTQYNPSVVASLWPGIVAKNPIAVMGMAGPDVAALRKRLHGDKVLLAMPLGGYGYDWVSGKTWITHIRATYAHEWMTALDWMLTWWPEGELPIKVGMITVEGSVAHVDLAKGTSHALKTMPQYRGKLEWLGAIYAPFHPVDVTDLFKPYADKGVDVFLTCTTIAQHIAIQNAAKNLNYPLIVMANQAGDRLAGVAKAVSWDTMEGQIDVSTCAQDCNHDIAFYKDVWLKYHPADCDAATDYDGLTTASAARTLVFCKVLENVVADVGLANLTSEIIYDHYFKIVLTEKDTLGLFKHLEWTTDAPFPVVKKSYCQIAHVKNGKYQVVKKWWPMVDVPKW